MNMKKKQYKLTFKVVPRIRHYSQRLFSWVVKMIQKYNLDGGGFLVPGQFAERVFTSSRRKWSDKKLKKRIDNQITKERRILKEHFNNPENAWDLDLAYIKTQIINDAVGYPLDDYITGRLVRKRPIDILYTSGKSYLVRRRK